MHAKLLCNKLNKLSWQWEVIFALKYEIITFGIQQILNIYRRLMCVFFYVTSRHRYKDNEVLQSWHSVAKQIPSGQAAKLVVTSRN